MRRQYLSVDNDRSLLGLTSSSYGRAAGPEGFSYAAWGGRERKCDTDLPFILTSHCLSRIVTVRNGVEVEYRLPAAARVRATLHDALGRRVGTLDAGNQNAGMHRLGWNSSPDGRKLSAGAYFVRLDMGREQARLKAVVE
jgi:hypothetical protein